VSASVHARPTDRFVDQVVAEDESEEGLGVKVSDDHDDCEDGEVPKRELREDHVEERRVERRRVRLLTPAARGRATLDDPGQSVVGDVAHRRRSVGHDVSRPSRCGPFTGSAQFMRICCPSLNHVERFAVRSGTRGGRDTRCSKTN
jgi:hypothetical protein